jgi:hypothetical protein
MLHNYHPEYISISFRQEVSSRQEKWSLLNKKRSLPDMKKTIQQMQKKEKILTSVINGLFFILSTTILMAVLSLVSSFWELQKTINTSTKIRFSIPSVTLSASSRAEPRDEGSQVQLKVYDVLGNEVATLVNEEKPAGSYEVDFDASQLSSGIYFYKLQEGSFFETKKMLLLK